MFPLPLELEIKIFKYASFLYKIEWLKKNLKMIELIPMYSGPYHRFVYAGFVQNHYYAITFLDSGYEIDSRDMQYYVDWEWNVLSFGYEFGSARCEQCSLFVCDHQ